MHVRDLNFMLWSEIFVHIDSQLHASHLILGCNPVYTSWQPFSQALLVDNPLLLHIDMQHPYLLPPNLTFGEVRDLSPQYTTAEDLASVRDASVEQASQNRRVHVPVGEPDALI